MAGNLKTRAPGADPFVGKSDSQQGLLQTRDTSFESDKKLRRSSNTSGSQGEKMDNLGTERTWKKDLTNWEGLIAVVVVDRSGEEKKIGARSSTWILIIFQLKINLEVQYFA